ncbi:hypothetical protein [Paraglaciecola chathamensis]|nr:hypothetical protein [Paraglaciecola chathamensis]MDO6560273.1 hypothetical protein [Paraglaciecola chathamensis]
MEKWKIGKLKACKAQQLNTKDARMVAVFVALIYCGFYCFYLLP